MTDISFSGPAQTSGGAARVTCGLNWPLSLCAAHLTLTFSSLQQSGFKFQFPPAKKNLFSMRAKVWCICP
jgi:hypothetical protein